MAGESDPHARPFLPSGEITEHLLRLWHCIPHNRNMKQASGRSGSLPRGPGSQAGVLQPAPYLSQVTGCHSEGGTAVPWLGMNGRLPNKMQLSGRLADRTICWCPEYPSSLSKAAARVSGEISGFIIRLGVRFSQADTLPIALLQLCSPDVLSTKAARAPGIMCKTVSSFPLSWSTCVHVNDWKSSFWLFSEA